MQIYNQKLRVDKARLEAEGHYIYAPIDGTVLTINVKEGEEVLSKTSLLTLADLSTIKVEIPVDELDIFKIALDQKANVWSDALPGKVYSATVTDIAREGTRESGIATFDVTLELEPGAPFKVGMSVEAEIITAVKNDVLLIPIAAVQERGKQKFVMVPGDGKQNKNQIAEIQTGLANEDYVEVISGLSEGDVIQYTIAKSTQSNMLRNQGIGMPGMPGMGRRNTSSSANTRAR